MHAQKNRQHPGVDARRQHDASRHGKGDGEVEHEKGQAYGDAPELVFAVEELIDHHAPCEIEPHGGDGAGRLPGHNAHIAVAIADIVQAKDHMLRRNVEIDTENAGIEAHQRRDEIKSPAHGDHNVQHDAPFLFLQHEARGQHDTAEHPADHQIQLVLQIPVGIEKAGQEKPDCIINNQLYLQHAVHAGAKKVDGRKGNDGRLPVGGIEIRPAKRRHRDKHIKEHQGARPERNGQAPGFVAPIVFQLLHGLLSCFHDSGRAVAK